VAQALANEVGSAPGIWVERGGAVVCALPGPPRELQPMATEHVLPRLRASAGWPPPLLTRQLRVAIVPESTVAQALAPIEARLPANVRLSYLAAPGEVRVRLLGVDRDAVDAVADEARSLLGDAVHAEGDRLLGESVVESLRERGSSVAVAESLTGGALCSALVDVPGASAVLRGSVTAYATGLKADLLGVDPDLLARVGAVHPDVAAAMAAGARTRLGAVWGVATTGVAGPDSQDGHPPGTVHVAAAGPEGIRVRSLVVHGARPLVRQLAVMHALEVLRRAVLGLTESPALGRPGPTG
jgi:nicotinamide-nucleotide amidase